MALIDCPECSKRVSDQSNACPSCGFPIAKISPFKATPPPIPIANAGYDKAKIAEDKPKILKPQRKDVFSKRNKVALAIVVIVPVALVIILENTDNHTRYNRTSAPSLAHSQVSTKEAQKSYEHYIGGNFGTMESCLSLIAEEAKSASMQLEILSDAPEKVTGVFNNDADMFFYCEKKETGTNGVYFEAAFPRAK